MNLENLTGQQHQLLTEYLAALRPGEPPQVCQVLTVFWPDKTDRSYFFWPAWEDPLYNKLLARPDVGICEARLRAANPAKPFFRINITADVSDNAVAVEFHEGPQFDTCIREKFQDSGENVRASIRLYFPAIDLMVTEFVGHFKAPTLGNQFYTPVQLSNGFRSKLFQIPSLRLGWNGCQATFGGQLATWEQISRNACKYNQHIPVLPAGVARIGSLDPDTGGPRTFCPKTNRAVCREVIGNTPTDEKLHFFGSDTVFDQSFLGHSRQKNLTNTYNLESRSRDPLGVLFGYRRRFPLQLVQVAKQDPLSESGTLLTRWYGGHGPIQQLVSVKLRGKTPQGQEVRLGEYLQPPLTNFPANTGTNPGNLNHIVHVGLNENPVKSAEITFDQIQAEGEGYGFREVRVYNADGTFVDQYSDAPAWCLRTLIESLRFGLRITPNYFNNEDWVALAAADAAAGRTFNHYVQGGTADKVIEDICRSMRYSLPFWHGDKLRIVPLGKETITGNLPTFYAQGENTNILEFDGSNLSRMPGEFKGMAAIRPLKKSDDEIPRFTYLTFDDDPNQVYGRLVTAEAQKLIQRDMWASRDGWQRPTEKEFVGIGVTNEAQAKALAISLLEVGEFEKGGTRNNCGFEFVVKGVSPDVLNLHPWALLHLVADDYAYMREPGPNYDNTGPRYEYFRVIGKSRDENLQTTLTVWAYPKGYYEAQ